MDDSTAGDAEGTSIWAGPRRTASAVDVGASDNATSTAVGRFTGRSAVRSFDADARATTDRASTPWRRATGAAAAGVAAVGVATAGRTAWCLTRRARRRHRRRAVSAPPAPLAATSALAAVVLVVAGVHRRHRDAAGLGQVRPALRPPSLPRWRRRCAPGAPARAAPEAVPLAARARARDGGAGSRWHRDRWHRWLAPGPAGGGRAAGFRGGFGGAAGRQRPARS